MRFVALLALGVAVVAFIPNATATTYDFCYASGFILQGKSQVLVQSSTTTARLYDLKGQILQTFELEQRIKSIQHSPDDRFVAVSGNWGRVRVWRIADGRLLANSSGGSLSFSPDSSLYCLSSDSGIDVFGTDDGSLVRHSDLRGRVDALQVGGEKAFRLWAGFEVLDLVSGRVNQHKGDDDVPLALTVDGRWALCGQNYIKCEGRQSLRVRDVKTGQIVADRGPLGSIGAIRAARDGGARFIVAAPVDNPHREVSAGYRYEPTEHTVKELWRVSFNDDYGGPSDFDPEEGLGVRTEMNLESRVFRLETGKTILTIPRIGVHGGELTSTSSHGESKETWSPPLWVAYGVTGIALGLWLTWCFRRRGASAVIRKRAG